MTSSPPQADASERPPGPNGLPLLGNKLDWAREPLAFPEQCAAEYGDVVFFQFGQRDAVLLSHPDYIQYVLAENNQNYTKGEYFKKNLKLLGEGLFTAEGGHWRRQRQLIDPIFHPDQIRSYGDTMIEHAERVADEWAAGEPVLMTEAMAEATFGIATETLFSVDASDEASTVSGAVQTVVENFQKRRSKPITLPKWIPTPLNREYHRAVDTFDEVVSEIIDEHREAEDPPNDVVTHLLAAEDEDGGMSDKQVRDEILTLMIAGHETVSLALSYTWYCLATNPEAEERLLAELDDVLGGRPPTVEDLGDLPYLEQVLQEAMRLYPPVYFMVREPKTDDEIGGYQIPAGTLIVMNQWVVHRDSRWHDDPLEYRPERFDDDADRHPLAYFPFSGGPRRCIGDRFAMLEARLILATLIQQYELKLEFEPPLELDPVMTLRPGTEMWMTPKSR